MAKHKKPPQAAAKSAKKKQPAPPKAAPVSVRFARGSEDALRLDRMALIHGSRSAALRAGLEALEALGRAVELKEVPRG